MGSRKQQARRRERYQFEQGFSDKSGLFDEARERMDVLEQSREHALLEKACLSKRRFDTKGEARSAIRFQEQMGHRGLTCYRCSWCKGYHLTSHPR